MAATMNGGGSGAWSYAVPLEETDGNARAYNPRVSQRTDHEWDDNGSKALQRSSSAWDLLSDSETAKQRRTSVRASNSTAVRKRSRNTLRDTKNLPQSAAAAQKGKAGGAYTTEDNSPWVHRDKLAQIEIQEMEEAGIYVRPSRRSQSLGPGRENGRSRSVSRSGSRKSAHDPLNGIGYDEEYAAAYPSRNYMNMDHVPISLASAHEELQPQRSPQRAEPYFDPIRNSEYQRTDEISTDHQSNDYASTKLFSQSQQQQHMARPSTSRIPVSRTSPVPVPHDVIERDSPLPRSRAGSQSVSSSWDELQYARKARSPSVNSHVLLESDHDSKRTTPPGSSNKHSPGEGSPQKSRVPKQTPTGRKSSIPNCTGAAARPGSSAGKRAPSDSRTPSAAATRRPGSSSGHKSRPSTGGHFTPDGEAPWIATMYKPDPRLPPDQQMLPTHAKRMMQEQWEKEGKTGTVYDRDFNLLNDEDLARKTPVLSLQSQNLGVPSALSSPTKSPSPNGSTTGNGWPLVPKSDSGSVRRPGTSGGYKITPTISSTPTILRSAAASPAPPPSMSPPHTATPRVPELSEKEEAVPKKACCCVLM